MKDTLSVAIASLFVTLGAYCIPHGDLNLTTLVSFLLIAAGLAVLKFLRNP